jgi:hypothetical protein
VVPDQRLEYSPNALFRSIRSLLVAPRGLSDARARSAIST